jgi:hypothetical protein
MKQRCVVGSHVRVVVRWCWIGKSLYSVRDGTKYVENGVIATPKTYDMVVLYMCM